MSRFTEMLVVSPMADGRTWYLRKPFGYDVGTEGSGDTVDVPDGFMTDFATVPRALWWLLPRWGRYGNAAVIHDFLYRDQKRTKKAADDIFLEAMQVLEVSWFEQRALYLAVRIFGRCAWNKRRRQKAKGLTVIADRPPVKCVELPAHICSKHPKG